MDKMRNVVVFISAIVLIAIVQLGCDSDDGTEGPSTHCSFNYTLPDPANTNPKEFGQTCTANTNCKYNVCLQPNVDGNTTNTKFAFCTRGCDCADDTASRLTTDEKETYTCLYPPGFEGSKHHVVLLCDTVADCQKVDPAWTECKVPTDGGIKKICHAL
jgi:hypothetical protein